MGLVTPTQISDATTADAADVNTPINQLANELNGNIDNANIKTAAAIATSKLADDAGITGAKLSGAYRVARQNDTTNVTETAARILTGWGYIPGSGGTFLTENITFNSAFTSAPIVRASLAGASAGTTWPAASGIGAGVIEVYNVTTTGFTVRMGKLSISGFDATTTFALSTNYFYTWLAVGA